MLPVKHVLPQFDQAFFPFGIIDISVLDDAAAELMLQVFVFPEPCLSTTLPCDTGSVQEAHCKYIKVAEHVALHEEKGGGK